MASRRRVALPTAPAPSKRSSAGVARTSRSRTRVQGVAAACAAVGCVLLLVEFSAAGRREPVTAFPQIKTYGYNATTTLREMYAAADRSVDPRKRPPNPAEVRVVGLANSGTNWIEELLRRNCRGVRFGERVYGNKHGWSHGDQVRKAARAGVTVIAVFKTPSRWSASIQRRPYNFVAATSDLLHSYVRWGALRQRLYRFAVLPFGRVALDPADVLNLWIGRRGPLDDFWVSYHTRLLLAASRNPGTVVSVPYADALEHTVLAVRAVCARLGGHTPTSDDAFDVVEAPTKRFAKGRRESLEESSQDSSRSRDFFARSHGDLAHEGAHS